MRNYIDTVKRVVLVILLLGIVFMVIFRPLDDTKGFPHQKYGEPVIFSRESNMPHTSIDQIVEDGERLYILFDKFDGIVQVYDPDGNYQQTMSFYAHRNGAFSIAAEGDWFYVRDENHNLYTFRNGVFISFTERESAAGLTRDIDFEANSPNYAVRRGSVWKLTGGEAVCVIRRPLSAMLYQNHLLFYITIGCVAVIAGVKLYQTHQKRRRKAQKPYGGTKK